MKGTHFVAGTLLACFCGALAGISTVPPDLEPIAREHEKKCVRCHGEGGKGDGSASKMLKDKPADWTDAARMSQLSDEDIYKIIELGGKGVGKSPLMPAFSAKLTKEQIADFVRFVRTFHTEQ